MRTTTKSSAFIAVLCLGVFWVAQVLAQPAAAIKPVVATPQLIGTEITVDLTVSNVQKLFGASFELRYTNTNLVKLAAPASSSVTAGPFLGSDVLFFANLDTAAGKIGIAISRKSGQASVSGNGVLARLKFVSLLSTPNNTPVTFSLRDVTANDSLGNALTLAAADSTIALLGLLVYPGDTNNDKVVNQADVLPIGVHFSETGPVRPNATLFWPGQAVFPWTPEASTYVDANGNGLINQADVLPIGLNWGRTRTAAPLPINESPATATASASATDLRLAVVGETNPGQEFWLEVRAAGAANLFGVAFELRYSPNTACEPLTVEAGSGMGNDILFLPFIDKSAGGSSAGKISIGLTRKSGQGGVDGSGVVARIKMRMANDAKVGTATELILQNAVANDPTGNPIQLLVFNHTLVTSVESGRENNMPTAFALHPNSPNPVRLSSHGATTIKYELPPPYEAETRVEIYDVLGKHVRTLVNQRQQPGRYSVAWDGRDEHGQVVATGVFIYQLRAGNFVQSRKLVLLQ
jgi:hypothetical protein